MPHESIIQFTPIDETTVGRFISDPTFTLSRQLRVLFFRLKISQTRFAERTLIDTGIVSRIVNERDRRGLNKKQTEKIAEFLMIDYCDDCQILRDGTVIRMDRREVDLWHKSIQCRASLERTLRNMFGPTLSLHDEKVLNTATDMIPAILSAWDVTDGQIPFATPIKVDSGEFDYPSLIYQFQNLSAVQRFYLYLRAHNIDGRLLEKDRGWILDEVGRIILTTDLMGLPNYVLKKLIVEYYKRETNRRHKKVTR